MHKSSHKYKQPYFQCYDKEYYLIKTVSVNNLDTHQPVEFVT